MNFVRSAIDPLISAVVIIAKVNWKAANARTGIAYTEVPFTSGNALSFAPKSENEIGPIKLPP